MAASRSVQAAATAISPSRKYCTRLPLLLPCVTLVAWAEMVWAGPTELLAQAAVSLAGQSPAAGPRTWTDSTGKFRIEARLIDFRDGVVRLKKTDGQVISLPIGSLSTADRAYVKQQAGGSGKGTDSPAAVAEIEFVSGTKSQGRITARDGQYVTIEFDVRGRRLQRKYPIGRIHAITIGDKREVLNESTTRDSSPPKPGSGDGANMRPLPTAGNRRTIAQIEATINEVGRTQPDWWDSMPLDYPKSLDLSWPQPPPQGWNNQKNVGQYVWDIINPNPSKWRSGVRFMHHLLDVHKDNPQLRLRVMNDLGRMYCVLLEDYPRAVFWWRQVGVENHRQFGGNAVRLAECYWKMGSKQMAISTLGRLRSTYFSAIKLLADMGETQQAIQTAERVANLRLATPGATYADMAYLIAGDACRIEGRYPQAVQYYQKVLQVPATGKQDKRIERNHQRARANIEGIKIFDALDLRKVADGTYRAESAAYAGQLHVEVTVANGRIESVKVVQHKEKQFYSALTDTPKKIIEKQGVKGVDAVTGATITSEAIINATAKALAKGLQ